MTNDEMKLEIKLLKNRLSELENAVENEHNQHITPTEDDIGTLVQLWSYAKNRWSSPAVLERVLSDDGVVMRAGNGVSDRARIYTGPIPVRMIPHDGGEQPVSDGATVLVKLKNGMYLCNGSIDLRWPHSGIDDDIIAFAVLDIREESNE